MEKFALSLINWTPKSATESVLGEGAKTLGEVLLAPMSAVLSRLPDSYQPVQVKETTLSQDVVDISEASNAVLLLAQIGHVDHVAELAQLMKKMKAEIQCGSLRIMVHSKLESGAPLDKVVEDKLKEKLKLGGRTEVVQDLSKTEQIVLRAHSLVEFLLLQTEARAVPKKILPSSLEMAFKLSQWMAQSSMDPTAFTYLFCTYLSTLCGLGHMEFMRRDQVTSYRCIATSDGRPSQWFTEWSQSLNTSDTQSKLKTVWVGNKKAAWVYLGDDARDSELTSEQARVLQAAAELADEFGVTGMASESNQPETVLSTSGLNH